MRILIYINKLKLHLFININPNFRHKFYIFQIIFKYILNFGFLFSKNCQNKHILGMNSNFIANIWELDNARLYNIDLRLFAIQAVMLFVAINKSIICFLAFFICAICIHVFWAIKIKILDKIRTEMDKYAFIEDKTGAKFTMLIWFIIISLFV